MNRVIAPSRHLLKIDLLQKVFTVYQDWNGIGINIQ